MFGISAQEFIVILVVAAIVLGPERLPRYTQQFSNLVRQLRRMANGTAEQMRSELGPEFDDIDWRKLDPRQYDPRRIVREALADSFDPEDPLGMRSTAKDAQELTRSINEAGRDANVLLSSTGRRSGSAPVSSASSASVTTDRIEGAVSTPVWDPDAL